MERCRHQINPVHIFHYEHLVMSVRQDTSPSSYESQIATSEDILATHAIPTKKDLT